MAAHNRTAPESVSPSTSQPPPARMIGPSATYFDPAMNLQRGVELELQFYNQMQQQQQQQQQQAQVQQQQQQYAQNQWQQQQQLQYPHQQQQYQQTAYPQTPITQEHYPPLQPYNLSPVGQYGTGSQLPEPTYQQPTTNGTHQDARKEPGSASKRNRNRKRRRSQDSSSSDSEDGKPARPQGACTHCKKLKMKCEFFDDEDTCRRCKASGHKCIVEGRKPRNAPNKREYLLAQIRHKDRTIAVLLKQVHDQAPTAASAAAGTGPANAASPPSTSSFNPSQPDYESEQSESILRWLERSRTATGGEQHIDISITAPEGNDQGPLLSLPPEPTPVGLMANLAIRDTSNKSASSNGDAEDNSDGEVGIARSDYFMNPGMDAKRLAPDDQTRPGILVKGIVNFEEVDELFEIFFSRLNVVLTVLDPVLHTPASTFAKCPFLFTVVCATASRYYTKRPELYTIAMHFAREAAGQGLTHSYKSIELCQAYIIMATYGLPAKRWEEDRNWLYIGMAIRIATDLNLHVPLKAPAHGPTEQQERETVNRTRVWLICFNLDRSTSTQFGKMSTLREGFIVRNSANWYRSNRMCSKYDIHLCAYTALLRIMARFIDEVFSDENSYTGLNTNLDWVELCDRYNSDMDNYIAEWAHRFATESDPTDPSCVYRTHLLPFVTSYARLVMHSFGFQHAIDRGTAESKLFFKRCLDAAKENCTTLLEKLAKTTYLRFAPDGHFVFASFATAFLIKMLRPEYKHLLDQPERDNIVTLVTRVVDVLGSRDISIDDKHTPKLYSRFLASLLGRQQAADKEARGRTRRGGTTTPKSGTHSPARGSTHSAQASIEELPPTVLPPLFIPAPSNTHAMVQQPPLPQPALLTPVPANVPHHHHQQHADGLLHVDLYSDAGTEVTIEQRPEEVPADEMLAGMHALSNPAWWDHAMMPGFSWPQPPQVDSPVFSRQQQFGMGFAQPLQQGMQVMLPQGQQPTYMLR